MLPKKKKKQLTYLDIRQEYLDSGVTTSTPPSIKKETKDEPSSSSSSSNDENNLSTDLRVRASEKRDILLYYILENFYTIDEVHKNKLYAFLLKLTELKAIDFDPFVQPGLYSQFRSQLDQVMLDVKNKGSVLPLLHGIHSSNYNYNMVSRAAVDFETISFLGKGGFGEVIKARNRIDGAMYALKKVKFRDLPNSEKNLEKVLREVKALAQLDHENVLRYFNAWIEVEHAGDYTKKMLEAVSHKPQLPSTLPVSPLSLSPPQSKLSVAVSDYSYEENEDSDSDNSDNSDNSEEEDESGSRFYPTATSTTESFYKEGEETEEDETEEDENEEGEGEEDESCGSLRSSSGVDVQFVEDFGSLNLNGDSTTSNSNNSNNSNNSSNSSNNSSNSNSNSNSNNNSNSNSTMSSESSGHTIVTLNGSSGSSSHGSRHGINVPMYTSSELSNGSSNTTSNEGKKTKKMNGSKGFHSPMVSLKGKKDNRTTTHNNNNHKVIHGHTKHHHAHVHTHALHTTHPSHGRRLRMSFESMLTNFRRGHEYTQEEKKKGRSHSKDKEKEKEKKGKTKVKGSDESEEDWESIGTSASKEFSHELSTLPYPSVSSLSSVPSVAPISPSKALAVVPFKPPAATPPKNRYVLYIQMQLCETRTLKSFLEGPGRTVKIMDNLVMFSQIVTGLNHIHSKGLIHRDLKPENLFFSPSGTIKIGDFGLSKQFSDMSATNKDIFDSCPSPHTVGVGTRSYASPEQIKSNSYTAKSDMYSLGIILFELFNIFDTHTERAKVLQDLRARIVPPIFYGRFPEVARCVLWLMEEMPENRPTTDEILRSSFMTLSQGPCSVTSLVVKQQEEIDKLQEKILMLQEQLKLASAGSTT